MNRPAQKHAPALPSVLSRELLKQALDFVLVLDEADTIADVLLSPDAASHALGSSIGMPLAELLGTESQPKLGTLLSSNSMEEDSEYRWRHVNFRVSADESIAVLVKYIEVQEPGRIWRAILCRDLTPIGRMQKKLMQAQGELESSLHRLHVDAAASGLPWRRQVGAAPLATIRQHWVDKIERECVREALGRCQGDVRAAALLLGVGVDYIRRLAPEDPTSHITH